MRVTRAQATQSGQTAERVAALAILDRLERYRAERIMLGADKAYQQEAFLNDLHRRNVTPYVSEYAAHSYQARFSAAYLVAPLQNNKSFEY